MDQLPETTKIIKSLIAPARYSDGPTLYMVCEAAKSGQCDIYEQLPDGKCLLWPESPLPGRCQAEAAIYAGKWDTAGSDGKPLSVTGDKVGTDLPVTVMTEAGTFVKGTKPGA